MVTLTIDLDDELARHVEDSARREQQSVSEWVKRRLTPEADRVAILQGMEERALAHGYPHDWMALYGSLADDEGFVAPPRNGGSRPAPSLTQG
jgi:hypothetical protein